VIRALALAALAAATIGSAASAQDPDNVLVIEVAGDPGGTVEIELFPAEAPQHVERIKTLAREGAYDGVVFHRVIDGFMAQTGDVEHGTRETLASGLAGTGGSAMEDLPAEFSDISFETGVVGMARSQDPDSANSQFFIMFAPAPHLNGQYTVVGRVISGQEVIDGLKRGAGPNGLVADPDWMAKVRVKGDS
jgi:cyclophilin family peptidyl-prolyl cis-trans isomerase